MHEDKRRALPGHSRHHAGPSLSMQDFDFLTINKFSYIINCSAEIPNYFDNNGIKYLKFKLIKERTHKLWD
jgi:hypothetical protein